MKFINSIITATGSYIPTRIITNTHFKDRNFFTYKNGIYVKDPTPGLEVANAYTEKTGILERRYVEEGMVISDIAALALINTGVDLSNVDWIMTADNFGEFNFDAKQGESVPNIGARVKQKAGLENYKAEAIDMVGGCPGWLTTLNMADALIKSGKAKSIAVIGAETLSYFSDPYNKDSTIFADGAGAVILTAMESDKREGIISYAGRSDSKYIDLLKMKSSVNPAHTPHELDLGMQGPNVYKYAVKHVPLVIEESVEKAGCKIQDISMFLAHQANEKLDAQIIKKILYDGALKELLKGHPEKITHLDYLIHKLTPLTINLLGNSSVATIPTLLDLIVKGNIDKYILNHKERTLPKGIRNLFKLLGRQPAKEGENITYRIHPGDKLCLFSVGAGMHCNSIMYFVPDCQYKHFPSFEGMTVLD